MIALKTPSLKEQLNSNLLMLFKNGVTSIIYNLSIQFELINAYALIANLPIYLCYTLLLFLIERI